MDAVGSLADSRAEALKLIDSADQEGALAMASRLRSSPGPYAALAAELTGLVAIQRGRLIEARAPFFEAAAVYAREGLDAEHSRVLGRLADIAGTLSKMAESVDDPKWQLELGEWGPWARIEDLPTETPETGFGAFMRLRSVSPTYRFQLAQRDLAHESVVLAERSGDVEAVVSARMKTSADLLQTLEIASSGTRPDLEVRVLVRMAEGATNRRPPPYHGGPVAVPDYSDAHRLCLAARRAALRGPQECLIQVLVAEADLARTEASGIEIRNDLQEERSRDVERALREAARISRELGLVQAEHDCLHRLSRFLRFDLGEASAAATLSERILELARRLGHPETISSALELSRLAAELGNSTEANSLAAERIRLARDGERKELAQVLSAEARHSSSQGDLTSARAWIEEAVEIGRELGSAGDLAFTLVDAGFIAVAAVDPEVALRHFEEAIAVQREYSREYSFATHGLESCLRSGAAGSALLGRYDLATAWLEELLEVIERGSSPHDRDRAELLCAVGECSAIDDRPDYARLRLIDSIRLLDGVIHATDYQRPVISPRGSPLGNRWDRENLERLSTSIRGLALCTSLLGSSEDALAFDGMADSVMVGAPPPPSAEEVEISDPFAGITKLLERLGDRGDEPPAAPWESAMQDRLDRELGDRAIRERTPEYQLGRSLDLEAILSRIVRT